MRIGIDARLWNETGVGRYIRNLVKYLSVLDKKNDYVLFVRDSDYENLKSQISNLKWKIVKTNIRWHSLEEQLKFPDIINKESLDLMHFPYFSVPVFYNRPFVVTIHDLILHNFPTGEASTLPLPLFKTKLLGYKFVVRRAAKKAKKIIVPSGTVKEEIIKRLKVPSEKIDVTYCGVDENINLESKIQNSELKSRNYFLYVGNAYPHKNLKTLIEAFKLFKSENKNDVRLVLAGREDYFYKKIQDELTKQKEGSINIVRPKDDKELAYMYRNAIALVVPSFMEGFGLTALEAMSNRCLVIASNIPVLKEVCGSAPVFFDPVSPKELKNKMFDVYKNQEKYKKNLENGIERVKKFSWEKMTEETIKIYESSVSV
ncbi:MAG: glycosyltransferase family 4 protein [Patescibacteria group bacterium]|nr:glycosyltransferase family 4 protein [Patescibacteria group bacterium]